MEATERAGEAGREAAVGTIARAAGPVVEARGLAGARLGEVVLVGPRGLTGEVIRLERDRTIVQVYEETSGLRVGDAVRSTGAALELEFGPGLLGSILDGIGRPLPALARVGDDPFARPFIERGARLSTLDRARRWNFRPAVAKGERVEAGDRLGSVQETGAIAHELLVPPGLGGVVERIHEGEANVDEPIAVVGGRPIAMAQRWPVRRARPVRERLAPEAPLVTGQRVVDALFPLAKGGAATIPGGFGTGKTQLEQSLARHALIDIVVYVGCGERGNELTEVLERFPALVDPRTGRSLLERTVVIANTSNMPVAAREASIYTGITIAEYYRDQGRDVLVLADSTSRWGEALREVSGRLEEMPGEDGYPAYLASRLGEFYERAGAVRCLGREGRTGSVTVVGAVSPPGGDFSEPITQVSLRLAGTFWALDTDLARRRHFPAIHWTRSYSLYDLGRWFRENAAPDWEELVRWALSLLEEESALQDIVSLVGKDGLAPVQRALLASGRALREGFLQQSALSERDAVCPLERTVAILREMRAAHEKRTAAASFDSARDARSAQDERGGPAGVNP